MRVARQPVGPSRSSVHSSAEERGGPSTYNSSGRDCALRQTHLVVLHFQHGPPSSPPLKTGGTIITTESPLKTGGTIITTESPLAKGGLLGGEALVVNNN